MIHGAACQTGNFARKGGDCFAEAMMKAGSVEEPAGAVAFLGATTSMDPYACCLAQKEAFTNPSEAHRGHDKPLSLHS